MLACHYLPLCVFDLLVKGHHKIIKLSCEQQLALVNT